MNAPALGTLLVSAVAGDAASRRQVAARVLDNPLTGALFAAQPEAELVDDSLLTFASLAPVYRLTMARLGVWQPGDAYLFDLIVPLTRLFRQRVTSRPGTYLIGIAGGPGAGKTTLSRLLSQCLQTVIAPAPSCLSLSIDDFYHSREERLRRGFKWRTLPGTHDTDRMARFVAALDDPAAKDLAVPRYDLGRDKPMADERLTAIPRICLFDGAMVGSRLPGYDGLARRIDYLVFLDLPVAQLKTWRFERERRLRADSDGAVGFSEEQMQAFWDEALGPSIQKWVRPNAQSADLLLTIDETRQVTSAAKGRACGAMGQADDACRHIL